LGTPSLTIQNLEWTGADEFTANQPTLLRRERPSTVFETGELTINTELGCASRQSQCVLEPPQTTVEAQCIHQRLRFH